MTHETKTALPAAPPAKRAHPCTVAGCGRLTLDDRCDRHRVPRAPAGERVIAAWAQDESSRTLGETLKETPRNLGGSPREKASSKIEPVLPTLADQGLDKERRNHGCAT